MTKPVAQLPQHAAGSAGTRSPSGPAGTYLDWASTAPLHPVARATLVAALDAGWADPARLYGLGRRARAAFEAAREQVASLIGARADEVSFPASGTAAAHLALLGTAAARQRVGRDVVLSAVEHSCVLAAAGYATRDGGSVHEIEVDRAGRVDLSAFTAALAQPGVALASLQSANHEVGTLQPVDAAGAACAAAGVPLHVDAAQTLGRLDPPARWDLLSASAHKWGGPPGVGVLAVRTGVRWHSPAPEDERGGGRVPGYENLPAVLAAAAALAALEGERRDEAVRLTALVERVRAEVPQHVTGVQMVGDPDPAGRAPHLVTFSCLYVPGEALLAELDRAGVSVSSGSSCTSSALTPSHVLVAMGALSHGNIRVSFGRDSTDADVDRLLAVLPGAVARLRDEQGARGL
ncbi:MAG TPA: aminotransferase class V-fold PLP-dependent enzyme [Mycobacteriales bacterium]|nr:aminotransferase class V-fold PLP-dependent enzyme [Mycobacteriales bacterium]